VRWRGTAFGREVAVIGVARVGSRELRQLAGFEHRRQTLDRFSGAFRASVCARAADRAIGRQPGEGGGGDIQVEILGAAPPALGVIDERIRVYSDTKGTS
jgi:hypothetical protein